jgi:hypothetical protein
MNTNTKGNIGLIKVMDHLISNDFFCFLPFTDTTVVDLIVTNENMITKRFQVKYKKLEKGGTCINLSTQRVVDRKKVDTDLTTFDYYAIYCPDNGKFYYIPTEYCYNKKMITLRVVDAKQKQKKIIQASDFEKVPFW